MPGGSKNIKPEDNPKPWKKGQSGNPLGRPKLPNLTKLIAKILGEENKEGKTAVEEILLQILKKGKKGDLKAAEMLLNRAYGMPKSSVAADIHLSDTPVLPQIVHADFEIIDNNKEEQKNTDTDDTEKGE